jgi:hypothetical protein
MVKRIFSIANLFITRGHRHGSRVREDAHGADPANPEAIR